MISLKLTACKNENKKMKFSTNIVLVLFSVNLAGSRFAHSSSKQVFASRGTDHKMGTLRRETLTPYNQSTFPDKITYW